MVDRGLAGRGAERTGTAPPTSLNIKDSGAQHEEEPRPDARLLDV